MGIIETISGSWLYLDTNICIYALEGYPEYEPILTSLFSLIDNGTYTAVTSELTLTVDDVDETDLEEYDRDEVGMYDRPERDDDGEFEAIKKNDPRYQTRKSYLHERMDPAGAFRVLHFNRIYLYTESLCSKV